MTAKELAEKTSTEELAEKTSTEELAEKTSTENPTRRLAYSRSGGSVGVWEEKESRFMVCAMKLLGKDFVQCSGFTVNGRPMVADSDWIPVQVQT